MLTLANLSQAAEAVKQGMGWPEAVVTIVGIVAFAFVIGCLVGAIEIRWWRK